MFYVSPVTFQAFQAYLQNKQPVIVNNMKSYFSEFYNMHDCVKRYIKLFTQEDPSHQQFKTDNKFTGTNWRIWSTAL